MARKKKERIHPGLRRAVFERDGYACRYCGSVEGPFQCDHVYPESRGGITTLENLATACRRCNRKKHATIGIWPMPMAMAAEISAAHRSAAERVRIIESRFIQELDDANLLTERSRRELEELKIVYGGREVAYENAVMGLRRDLAGTIGARNKTDERNENLRGNIVLFALAVFSIPGMAIMAYGHEIGGPMVWLGIPVLWVGIIISLTVNAYAWLSGRGKRR